MCDIFVIQILILFSHAPSSQRWPKHSTNFSTSEIEKETMSLIAQKAFKSKLARSSLNASKIDKQNIHNS